MEPNPMTSLCLGTSRMTCCSANNAQPQTCTTFADVWWFWALIAVAIVVPKKGTK